MPDNLTECEGKSRGWLELKTDNSTVLNMSVNGFDAYFIGMHVNMRHRQENSMSKS